MNRQTLTNGGNGLELRMIIQRILDQADQHELTTGQLADLFLFSLLMPHDSCLIGSSQILWRKYDQWQSVSEIETDHGFTMIRILCVLSLFWQSHHSHTIKTVSLTFMEDQKILLSCT